MYLVKKFPEHCVIKVGHFVALLRAAFFIIWAFIVLM